MAQIDAVKLDLVARALTDEWQTTQDIARKLGVEWAPGSHGDLDEVRADLYRLNLLGEAAIRPQHNGHKWRLAAHLRSEDS